MMQQFHPRISSNSRELSEDASLSTLKKIKNKKKVFQNAHGKAMAYKFKGIRQGLNNRNLTLSHRLHLDEKAEVVKK